MRQENAFSDEEEFEEGADEAKAGEDADEAEDEDADADAGSDDADDADDADDVDADDEDGKEGAKETDVAEADAGGVEEAKEGVDDGGYEGGDDAAAAAGDEAAEAAEDADEEGQQQPRSSSSSRPAAVGGSGSIGDDRRLSEATSNEGDDEDAGDEGAEAGAIARAARDDGAGGDDEDEEREVRVKGQKRREMEEIHNPKRARRRRLREYYIRPAGYSFPTAMMIMNLVWGRNGSHVPLDLVWQAVLGTTDQYHRARIDHKTYESICEYLTVLLGEHLTSAADRARYVVAEGDNEVVAQGAETGHIQEVREFRFFMYRHWSLFDSMYHSPYIASKMPIWQQQGTLKLQELLAKMGMPLDHCKRQSFNTIRADLRPHFKQQLLNDAVQAEYNLRNPDIVYQSFSRYNSFKNPVGASDVAFAATSLLEMCRSDDDGASNGDAAAAGAAVPSSGISRQQAFNDAYDCLGAGTRAEEMLRKGVAATLVLQRSLVKKAAVMLEGHDSISKLNRLYFAYVQQAAHLTGSADGAATSSAAFVASSSSSSSSSGAAGAGAGAGSGTSADLEMDAPFSRPHVLTRLGQFIMEVKRNLPKKQGGWVGRRGLLPLILIAEKRDSCVVVGISPLATAQGAADLSEEDVTAIHTLTNFRQFYKLALKELRMTALHESFDAHVIEVARDDVQDFLGTLDFLLRKATPDYLRG